jgi:hypothetical protein
MKAINAQKAKDVVIGVEAMTVEDINIVGAIKPVEGVKSDEIEVDIDVEAVDAADTTIETEVDIDVDAVDAADTTIESEVDIDVEALEAADTTIETEEAVEAKNTKSGSLSCSSSLNENKLTLWSHIRLFNRDTTLHGFSQITTDENRHLFER